MDLSRIQSPVDAYEAMTHTAQTADEVGYEAVWLVDHVHTAPQPSQDLIFESWTTTAALSRDTKRVRIGQMVSCNGYRNPALLAKMASTVDVLSHGRLTVGIGAGSGKQEHYAYGYEWLETPERLSQLSEAVHVLQAMWTQEEAIFEGNYYQVHGAINQPKGVQKPHIPLLIGGSGEKVTLKLVAEYGDACNIGGDVETIGRKLAILQHHCENVGRNYQNIYRTAGTICMIADTDEEALASVPEKMKEVLGTMMHSVLIGSLDTIRRRIAAYEAVGIQELVIRFPDPFQLFELYKEVSRSHQETRFPDPLQLDSIRCFAKEFIS